MSHGSSNHFDASGAARMVGVGDKPETPRRSVASARIAMQPETLRRIAAGGVGKGDVLGIARLAAITAAKATPTLIPLCHPVRLVAVDVAFDLDHASSAVAVRVEIGAVDRTGPEMEAMTAATAAVLTIYDMCKGSDRSMTIEQVCLLEKSGGKSGQWVRG